MLQATGGRRPVALRSPFKASFHCEKLTLDVPRYIVSWGLTNINMKKTKIKWRLGRLPEPQEIALLIEKGVINKEEAREILFSLETEEDRSKKSLQDEIKFLRELVAKLSTNRSVIIETIKEVEKPWKRYDWYQPYHFYMTSAGTATAGLSYTVNASSDQGLLSASTETSKPINLQASVNSAPTDFKDIKTF